VRVIRGKERFENRIIEAALVGSRRGLDGQDGDDRGVTLQVIVRRMPLDERLASIVLPAFVSPTMSKFGMRCVLGCVSSSSSLSSNCLARG
jgi:hypothetical protein